MKKITIRINDGTGNFSATKEVDAYPCILPGFENFSFFVHRCEPSKKYWSVTEKTTGLQASWPFQNTKKAAVNNCIDQLTNRGVEELQRAIERMTKQYGILNQ